MGKKLIYHIDVNAAFLSWEADYRIHHLGGTIDLRNEIAAVGGDMAARHGIILAKSIPAKKYGIRTGEIIHLLLSNILLTSASWTCRPHRSFGEIP